MEACQNSGQAVSDHFAETRKMIATGKGAKRPLEDYQLTRYACYLIVQNADPEKPIVALGQTYFAVQTRRQEIADELAVLPEEQKRLILRSEMTVLNNGWQQPHNGQEWSNRLTLLFSRITVTWACMGDSRLRTFIKKSYSSL